MFRFLIVGYVLIYIMTFFAEIIVGSNYAPRELLEFEAQDFMSYEQGGYFFDLAEQNLRSAHKSYNYISLSVKMIYNRIIIGLSFALMPGIFLMLSIVIFTNYMRKLNSSFHHLNLIFDKLHRLLLIALISAFFLIFLQRGDAYFGLYVSYFIVLAIYLGLYISYYFAPKTN